MNIEELTISQVHEAYRDGTWTCRNLIQAFLNRIEMLDKNGPCINSTLAISDVAVQEAAALDDYFKTKGQFIGRLHGIPVLVKDQADTKGMVTTYGSHVAKNNIPTKDAFVVEKLKSEGAIILGKTTMGDWATTWFSTSSVTNWKFTHNPYKLGHDVGGSSSGSAAAVAANFSILAVAEDTGGSIRCPASFTNLVGLRCTPGLISRTGFCPLVKTQDTPGPIARTVSDCALMLDCMVGFDPNDEWTAVAVTAPRPNGGSYAAELDPNTICKSKIGIIRSLFGSDSDPACNAVNKLVNHAISTLQKTGTIFVDVELPRLRDYMTTTPAYVVRSRSDINAFLSTKPHLPQDVADIVPENPLILLSILLPKLHMAHPIQQPTRRIYNVSSIVMSSRDASLVLWQHMVLMHWPFRMSKSHHHVTKIRQMVAFRPAGSFPLTHYLQVKLGSQRSVSP